MTNGSISALTVETAPMTLEELSTAGRFQLRRLAEELTRNGVPIVDTDEKRQAFMQSHSSVMAETVLMGLKQLRGGAPAKVAAPVQEPVAARAPVVAEPTRAEEPAAPHQEEVAVPRQPRTSAKADSPTPPAKNGTNGHGAVLVDVVALAQSLERGFENLALNIGKFAATTDKQDELFALHEDISTRVNNLEKKMEIAVGLMLVMAQNSVNMSVKQLIDAAQEEHDNAPFPCASDEPEEGTDEE